DRYKTGMLAEARQALAHEDPRQAVLGFFEWTISSMTRGMPTRGCLTSKTAMEEDNDSPEIQRALRGMVDDLETAVRERLSRDDAAGRLALSPADAARAVITYTRGLVVIERLYSDTDRLRQAAGLMLQMLFREAA
ncbi:MAG TPA: TetR/AcrR family transcriptional regulator, partial [Bordetella sp.]|nr:TetR/AcrR family transcriptional regulator [Bordetella sp.]